MKWFDRLTPAGVLQALVLGLLVTVWWGVATARGSAAHLPMHRTAGFAFAWTVASIALLAFVAHRRKRARARHIDEAPFPRHLRNAVRKAYPALADAQLADIERGLRQFFHCHLRARQFVAMPSHAVDAMWHAFILDTRAYQRFCRAAFGRFLHHSPAETLGRDAKRNDGLRRTWYHACRLEGIDPRVPASLPLLFALDTALAIPGGFVYVPDCRDIDRQADGGTQCGTSFSDGSSPGDNGGFGGEAGSHGDGVGDAGGDGGGGGGDGGGGCGGGD